MIRVMNKWSENLALRTDFFALIKSSVHGLSVKPEIFSVSGHAAQYFLYLRSPQNQWANLFNKLKNQYNYG